MTDIPLLIKSLADKNNTIACGALKTLAALSEQSDEVYTYMDIFIEMLGSGNSYVRNRGLILIAANARWDRDFKIDEIIDGYLKHITDPKPITARQCIASLPKIVKSKPNLKQDILNMLKNADVSRYPDSMRGLVQGDIRKALKEIENQ